MALQQAQLILVQGPVLGRGALQGPPFFKKMSKMNGLLARLGGREPSPYEEGEMPVLAPLPQTKTDWDRMAAAVANTRLETEDDFYTCVSLVKNLIALEEEEDDRRLGFYSLSADITRVLAVSFVFHIAVFGRSLSYVLRKYITSFREYPSTTALMFHQLGFLGQRDYRRDEYAPVFRVGPALPARVGAPDPIETFMAKYSEVFNR